MSLRPVANVIWRVLGHRTFFKHRNDPNRPDVEQKQRWLSLVIEGEADAIDACNHANLWAAAPESISGTVFTAYVGGFRNNIEVDQYFNLPGLWYIEDLPVSYEDGKAVITYNLSRAYSEWFDVVSESGTGNPP